MINLFLVVILGLLLEKGRFYLGKMQLFVLMLTYLRGLVKKVLVLKTRF